jgi:beta-lactamase class D
MSALPSRLSAASGCGKIRILALLLLTGCAGVRGEAHPPPPEVEVRIHRDLSHHFRPFGVEGSFVLYDGATGTWVVHEPERAERGFVPASTFKIPNTLIALETGVIGGVDETISWDGVRREVEAWNRDHTLATAFPASAVWFYQEIARRVGEARMRAWVERLGYGNRSVEGGLDLFWLTGELRISALEQVEFLRRVHDGHLPVSERSLDALREIMHVEERDGAVLRGKTGWGRLDGRQYGWLVGWVEREGGTAFFALQLDTADPSFPMIRARDAIVRGVLAELEVYP